MRAAEIFFFARVTRAAIVDSDTRNAWAISSVVSPQTSRNVNATCASRAIAGWQQVKTSRSRSSGITSLSTEGSSSPSGSTSNGSLRRRVCSRRRTSRARRRAVVVSQAPGERGTPSRSQASSAAPYASCTHSSARSMLPATRTVAAST